MLRLFGLDLPVADWAKEEGVADSEVQQRILDLVVRKMAEKAASWGPEVMRDVEKSLLLQVLDQVWKEHLLGLDHLRHGIGLRAYGQKDPLNEYKGEAFEMFNAMLEDLDERVTLLLSHMELQITGPDGARMTFGPPRPSGATRESFEDPAFARESDPRENEDRQNYGDAVVMTRPDVAVDPADPTTWGKVGRNQACPCGSGRKYKHCHGRDS